MSVVPLPPPVEIGNDGRKAIIDGLKRILAKFQSAGAIDSQLTYQQLISDPSILAQSIQTFLENRELADDVVQPQAGDGVVRDDDTPLVCGPTINQIQALLVRTCAKKIFESNKRIETVKTAVTRKRFLFFTKTEQVEVRRPVGDPAEERKLREILKYVAFSWQLPLLDAYRSKLTYQQIIELGDDLVALPSEEHIAEVAEFEPAALRKVRQMTGGDFTDILAYRPRAISGIAVWNQDMYDFYRRTLGPKAWDFFSREKSFFNVVASFGKPEVKVYGDVLCFIAGPNLEEFQRLNIDKAEVLVQALRGAFGDKLPDVLAAPALSKEVLRKLVDNLVHSSQEKDKLMLAFAVTMKSMVPTVMTWLAKQPH